ncbi:hypothetical protein MLD38_000196 [Melastoma candidum]|uniref:Uncharacterized protein n=1 Tax=Melastoma candidum TaxID=119954 RepID=A0ACB9S923_9MYRT|nr:hypothetical protein MLD38_000196 [Melastoma candidum]
MPEMDVAGPAVGLGAPGEGQIWDGDEGERRRRLAWDGGAPLWTLRVSGEPRTPKEARHRRICGGRNGHSLFPPPFAAITGGFDLWLQENWCGCRVLARCREVLARCRLLLQERWLADAAVSAYSEDAADVELSRVELLQGLLAFLEALLSKLQTL